MKQPLYSLPLCLWLSCAAISPAEAALSFQKPEAFSASLASSSGIQTAEVRELVFMDGALLSRLDWQEDIAFMNRLDAALSVFGMRIALAASFSVPLKKGVMEDRDWQYPIDKSALTNYSRHTLRLDKRFELGGALGYTFDFNTLRVTLLGGVRFINQGWAASGGFALYGNTDPDNPLLTLPLTGEEEETPLSGTLVSYEQSVLLPLLGFDLALSIRDKGLVTFYAYWYPYVYANALDTHIRTNTRYYDELRGGQGFAIGFSAGSSFARNKLFISSVSIILRYEYYRSTVGASFINNAAANQVTPGIENSLFSFALCLRFG